MKHTRTVCAGIALALAPSAVATAQAPEPETPTAPAQRQEARAAPQFRLGSSLTLPAGERAEDVAVIFGSAEIEGTVEGDIAVILGNLRLGSASAVEGDVVVVGGSAEISPGAVANKDFVVVGGGLDAPAGFSSGGDLVVVGGGSGTRLFAPVWAWISKGLLWGRPLVPELLWSWIVVLLLGLLYLGTNVIFERPVRDVASALTVKPLTCFLVGGVVVLLIGPVSLLLASSVVGLPAVPLLWFAVLLAVVLGRVGVARWIGGRIFAEEFPGDRAEAARSVAIGFALVCAAYMVPVLGLAAWTLLGVLALGAATHTIARSLRRENPRAAEPARGPAMATAPHEPADGSGEPGMAAEAGDSPAEPVTDNGLPEDQPLAEFPVRACAVALDFVSLATVCHLLEIGTVLTLLLFVIYSSAMWAWRGTTVGGMICRTCVIRSDGRKLTVGDGIVRGVASVISIAFLGLGWFWAAWDARRQAWHDRAAGTYVVRTAGE